MEDEHETERTYEITKIPTFSVRMGRGSSLELRLRRAVEIPGHAGAIEHAEIAFKQNPHAIVVLLDLTTPLTGNPGRASGAWLDKFCEQYELLWHSKGNRKKNRARSITIVMNKIDKVKNWDKKRNKYKSILGKLIYARGSKLRQIQIMPCVLVTNPNGSQATDKVITAIAKSLT